MYISISPQKLGNNYSQSAADFITYLEKENLDKPPERMEHFFNQYEDNIKSFDVMTGIDENTAKLKKTEPRYYSITINPSKHELRHISNDPERLKNYTRQLMKEYTGAFHREIQGRPISIDDIKYYAKIEYQRTFKGNDREIRENAPFINRIAKLEHDIRKVHRGELSNSISRLQKEIHQLNKNASHKINGKMIRQGMQKKGEQTHVHIIVSRKDVTNRHSLSPGSKYKASEVIMHGKTVKRGFERDKFYSNAEKTFDKMFGYDRNFVERYEARKAYIKNPKLYFAKLMGLPVSEKQMAFRLLKQTGMPLPYLSIPPNQVGFALRQFKRLLDLGVKASSIGY